MIVETDKPNLVVNGVEKQASSLLMRPGHRIAPRSEFTTRFLWTGCAAKGPLGYRGILLSRRLLTKPFDAVTALRYKSLADILRLLIQSHHLHIPLYNARSYTYNKMQFTYMINIVLAALLVGRSGCSHSNFKHLCVD